MCAVQCGLYGMGIVRQLFFFCTTAAMVVCFAFTSYTDPGVVPHSEQVLLHSNTAVDGSKQKQTSD